MKHVTVPIQVNRKQAVECKRQPILDWLFEIGYTSYTALSKDVRHKQNTRPTKLLRLMFDGRSVSRAADLISARP